MRVHVLLGLLAVCVGPSASQDAAFPLESLNIEGSSIPQSVIAEIAGLRMAAPINKPGIEQACEKLQGTGLFASVAYRYAPGPKKGYAVTLILDDQSPLVNATIDVPGADEDEAWKWLSGKFRRFDRQVPQAGAAQDFLAHELEAHLGNRMRGQRLVVRMDSDLATRALTVSFEPEVLPRVLAVSVAGNESVASSDVAAMLNKVAVNSEYTARKFAAAVDLNLRRLYEEHGFYRARFKPGPPQWSDAGVTVAVAIEEGLSYRLGKVELLGDNLPLDAMLAAARFPSGKVANWKQIQDGIWEMERVVKRTGFFEAAAFPNRSLDDATHVLHLRVQIEKGPLYRFGELRITGLNPDLHERARRIWKPKTGDPYDYAYPNDFLQAFSRTVDFRSFRKYDAVARKGNGDHVIDIELTFEPR